MDISNKLRNTLVAVAGLLALAACATTNPTTSDRLDPLTGVTVTYSSAPLILYRDNPSRAAYARNYLQLGPIQVNQSGTYRYYLWLGIWNTMQSVEFGEQRTGFDSIVVFADGEPLSLELRGWTPDAIGVSEPIYLKPVASSADAYYAVTADQIRLISEASDIRVQTTGAANKEFGLWDEQKSARHGLSEFVRLALL